MSMNVFLALLLLATNTSADADVTAVSQDGGRTAIVAANGAPTSHAYEETKQNKALCGGRGAHCSEDRDCCGWQGHTADEWKTRRIYQVVTDRFARNDSAANTTGTCDLGYQYCGGTFAGLRNQLDHIKRMGFNAIWISPVVKQVDYPSTYHGYHAADLEEINPKFGGAKELKSLIDEMHNRDMWIMVDVVPNHMGGGKLWNPDEGNPKSPWQGLNNFKQFDKIEYYHLRTNREAGHTDEPGSNHCIVGGPGGMDWDQNATTISGKNLTNVQECWLSGLPDLKQEHQFVRSYLKTWIRKLVQNFTVDGLRIDACTHMQPEFLNEFWSSAGVYATCEGNMDGRWELAKSFVGDKGVPAILNYPMVDKVISWMFRGEGEIGQLSDLWKTAQQTFGEAVWQLNNFIENHDIPRFLSISKPTARNPLNQLKSMLAWSFFWPGIPIMYYGGEFALTGQDPNCSNSPDPYGGRPGCGDPWNREPLWPVMDANPLGSTGFKPAGTATADLRDYVAILGAVHEVLVSGGTDIADTMQELHKENDLYCWARGKDGNEVVVCLTAQSEHMVEATVKTTCFARGEKVVNAVTGEKVQVDGSGLHVVLDEGMPAVFRRAPKTRLGFFV